MSYIKWLPVCHNWMNFMDHDNDMVEAAEEPPSIVAYND